MTDEFGEIGQGHLAKVKWGIHQKSFLEKCLHHQWAKHQVEDESSEASLLTVALLTWGNTICSSRNLLCKFISRKVLQEKENKKAAKEEMSTEM